MNRRSLMLLMGSVGWLKAADPWKEKKAAEFTPEDVQKLASKSPWSKEATVSMQMPSGGPGAGGGGGGRGGGGGGMAGGGGGGMGGGGGRGGGGGGGEGAGGLGGGGGAMGGGMPQIKVTVRWESAQMIIDASKRQRSKEAQAYYILSATGLPMMGQGRGQGGQEKKAAPSPEERRNAMVARMKESTMLERKGKDPIYPERVEILEGNNARLFVFLFPKEEQAITMGDKEVVFHSKLGAMDLKAKFSLKEMMYEGKLEL